MRIVDLEVLVLGTSWRNLTFLKLTTDNGLVGLGEARLTNRTEALLAYLDAVRDRYILGVDPFDTERLVRTMIVGDQGRPGEVVTTAIALVEMACWDLKGKALGVPVYQLLGGAVRDSIPAYANGWYRVDRTPDAFAEAARKVASLGYRGLKLDPFGTMLGSLSSPELAEVVRLCEAVRAAVGPEVDVFIDMHSRFGVADAIRVIRALERIDPGWVEEPVDPLDANGHRRVADAVGVPVATGERLYHRSEFLPFLEQRACAILQPDLTHCCGLAEAKAIASMAEAFGMLVAPHNVAGPVAMAANLHLAATLPNLRIMETFNDFEADSPLPGRPPGNPVLAAASGCPGVVDGAFALPRGPGWGVELDEEIIRSLPFRPGHFNIFSPDWHKRRALGGATG
ncbi:mandelate racemase/muconate lactonizing enzyme family protein [Tautonia sociabilis]|uniref:Mandelate racemase/muconate lactonizing enzyme family protein n=1 Tax=Tautonia sociabilis TaxID=2080755 RepID=A0A432MJ45_9BACT|nr:mandelate racemase/muconate lactonizing enzyme family protein [Tautonia sociabilis]RUL87392.1 mandelate racemase/muconate lactonizing enzyme family protein [Tautonia sociabilis]